MPIWPQHHDPLQSVPLSTFAAALPVLTLFFVLLVLKRRVWEAALGGMIMALLLAMTVFGMPAAMTAAAAVHGFIFGVLRIAWIVMLYAFVVPWIVPG
jgi:lactate permease